MTLLADVKNSIEIWFYLDTQKRGSCFSCLGSISCREPFVSDFNVLIIDALI